MTTGQSLNLAPGNFISAIPGQPLRSGIITPEIRRRLIGNFQIAQRLTVPQTVTQPPSPSGTVILQLTREQGLQAQQFKNEKLGNPLIPQTNQFKNTLSPGAQGGGGPIAPLL